MKGRSVPRVRGIAWRGLFALGAASVALACSSDDGGNTPAAVTGPTDTTPPETPPSTPPSTPPETPPSTPPNMDDGNDPPVVPPQPTLCPKNSLSWDELYEAIEADIFSEDDADRPFIRYLSISNRYNAGACDQVLEADRWAMNKFINSISQDASVTKAKEVKDTKNSKSIYKIDLRDYKLDVGNGPFVVGDAQFEDGWEAILAFNQYAVEFEGENVDNVVLQTGTEIPVMFVDSMIDQATVGDLYYGLLQLGVTQPEVVAQLGIDQQADLDQRRTVFAGTTNSAVSKQDRLVLRNDQDAGGLYYYESFDLDPNEAGQSVLADPLGFSQGQQAGSEAVFSLPNGLQAYIIFDELGNRLEESPILNDTFQNDNVLRSGVSCMRCHDSGLVPFKDQVLDYALANTLDVVQAIEDAGFEFQDLEDFYPDNDELSRIFTEDSRTYDRSLAQAGVPIEQSDPVSGSFYRFDEDLDLRVLAGDLLYPVDQLAKDLPRLDPQLAGLDDAQFHIDRDDVTGDLYVDSLCKLTVFTENQPVDAACDAAAAGLADN